MTVSAFILAAPLLAAAPDSGHRHGHGPSGGAHGNPKDLDHYIAKMVDPTRDEWQKPDELVTALGLAPGNVVCDIGAGPGYFALRLSRTVGESGGVFAVDVEPKMLEALRERIDASGARNVTPVLALPGDPLLPPASCDLILIVDTYHHFPDGPAYLRRLVRALKPGGRIANVDFHKREGLPVGPPIDHLVSEADFRRDAKAAGLEAVAAPAFLPHQYFVILKPGAAKP